VSRHNMTVVAQMTPGYQGGQKNRQRSQVLSSTAPEDQSMTSDYANLIAAAMNLYRNDPMTRSIVDTTASYLGQSRPMASTGDADFDAKATEYFNSYWWGMADARRRPGVDFGTMQEQWSKWSWIGGDMLYALRDDGLYPYEGIQVRTPWSLRADKQIRNGVRIQAAAPHRISHYYVMAPRAAAPFGTSKEDFVRFAQNAVIFAPSKYWRTAMLRGVPELHAVIDALQDWDATNGNVQGMIKLHSSLWTVERDGALSGIGANFLNKSTADGTQVEYTPAQHGMRVRVKGDPEHDFKMQKLENPGSEHVPYMEYMGRIIAAGVGLPYEIVAHLYTNGSYTANRAARCDFKQFLMDRWAWRNKVLNQRVWNWVIARAIKAGELPPAPLVDGRSQWWKCTWTLPYMSQIDEGKEITADVAQWGACTTSLADLAQEQGRTRGQLLDAHDNDILEMKARAEALGVTLAEYAGQLFKASAQPANQGGEDAT
ncbi:MAG: phage portal protein, partial [Pseudomonadota bacterium]